MEVKSSMSNYFTVFATLLIWGNLSVSAKNCSEKDIGGLLTLRCSGYNEIPNDFKQELYGVIKSMDMSQGNEIAILLDDAFKMNELTNINKLKLSYCQIRDIQINAFSSLISLSDLDLSNNNLNELNLNIFQEKKYLKIINLSNNKYLSALRGQFPEMKSLTTIDLSNCNLHHLKDETFYSLTNLATLNLNGNNFTTLSGKLREPLYNLNNVYLGNNPWNCNCHLRELVKSYLKTTGKSAGTDLQNLQKPSCKTPVALENKYWNALDVQPDEFVCEPKIMLVLIDKEVVTEGDSIFQYESETNITISCKIWADPPADIYWKQDEIPLKNDTRRFISHVDSDDELTRTIKLTIYDSREQDRGQYQCHAENRALAVFQTITLNVTGISAVIIPPIITGGYSTKTWLWVLLGMLVAAIVISLVVFVILLLRRRKREKARREFKSSQAIIADQMKSEKSGDTAPLLNAPGNTTPTSMPSTTGTESNSFVHFDYRQQQIVHVPGSVPPSPTPLVLMAPNRPGSSQSLYNDAVARREAFRNQNVDLMSFDTVRYQKRPTSVSSFTSLPPPETHRIINGYVTLPRRPKNPNWGAYSIDPNDSVRKSQLSSNPNLYSQGYSTLPYRMKKRTLSSTGLYYDSSGPRTTADGYSNVSLNKIDGGSMSALDTINNALSNSTSRGKIAAKKSQGQGSVATPGTGRSILTPGTGRSVLTPGTGRSMLTPGTGRSLHNSFNFEPIEEVESTPGGSEVNINANYKPNIKENGNVSGPKYKKKKPPELTNLTRTKLPSNFHQRISEINKSFERPKSMGEMSSKEVEVNNVPTSSESNIRNMPIPPPPPPKPVRLHSAPDYASTNSIIYGTIHEEVEGTAV